MRTIVIILLALTARVSYYVLKSTFAKCPKCAKYAQHSWVNERIVNHLYGYTLKQMWTCKNCGHKWERIEPKKPWERISLFSWHRVDEDDGDGEKSMAAEIEQRRPERAIVSELPARILF
jgi:hypothetical protein